MAMVEAPGVNGDTVLVQRPWTLSEIKEAMVHLPLPGEVGGNRMPAELVTFCRDFRPTTHELRRLLVTKLGPQFSRINVGWLDNDLKLSNPNWDHNDNNAYHLAITGVCDRICVAFPFRLDMTKINGCRQKDGEICNEYLVRLTELHNAHSGIDVPADINLPEVTVWEAHLRNCFLNGIDADISERVKDLCVTWDSAQLSIIVAHVNHAEKRLRDARK